MSDGKMDPEIKAKWVAALRSGEYKQTRGMLKKEGPDGPSFCCLGVLADVIGEGEVPPGYAELNYRGGQAPPTWAQSDLVRLNDGRRWTFNQIADYIEERL